MSKTIGAVVLFGMAVSMIILGPRLGEREVASSVVGGEAAAAIRSPSISPLDIMTKLGKNLPVEVWDAF
jgi:hypothetical protein